MPNLNLKIAFAVDGVLPVIAANPWPCPTSAGSEHLSSVPTRIAPSHRHAGEVDDAYLTSGGLQSRVGERVSANSTAKRNTNVRATAQYTAIVPAARYLGSPP